MTQCPQLPAGRAKADLLTMKFLEYTFTFTGAKVDPEILIAYLDSFGYEGFQEPGDRLIACLPASKKDEKRLADLLERVDKGQRTIQYSCRELPDVNWNARWESDFQPIEIDDFVRIRASFHAPVTSFAHEIVIDPKMSFGTGHHETTRLMMRAMKTLSFKGKKVLDLGCGTAVLSILASRMQAESMLAVDIDEWAVLNSRDNVAQNNCSNITIRQGDAEVTGKARFAIVLANINRNVLLEYMFRFREMLAEGGDLVLSGIMLNDRERITAAAENNGFQAAGQFSEKDWCALVFRKDPAD